MADAGDQGGKVARNPNQSVLYTADSMAKLDIQG